MPPTPRHRSRKPQPAAADRRAPRAGRSTSRSDAPPGRGAGIDRADDRIRLQKLLAAAGLGSRREIEGWIAAGRIMVAGRRAQLGDRASLSDRITLDGRPLSLPARRDGARVLLYHKPVGEVVTRSDPEGRATVFDRLPPLRGGKWIAVGRLDLNSSGLLLLTDSGELANRLMHPRHGFEREYAVRARGVMDDAKRRQLVTGVRLDDRPAKFERIAEQDPDKGDAPANRWYEVTIREGRYREVRRLFEAAGMQVSRLVRTRYGPIALPRDLAPGAWRELEGRQLGLLLEASSGPES